MKKLLIVLFSLFGIVAVNAQLANQDEVLSVEGGALYATLAVPPTSDPVPLVIIVAGSGPTDRDGNSVMTKNNCLSYLAKAFLQHNIATLRYDKRGVGASKSLMINEADLRFDDYVADLNAWVNHFKDDTRFSEIIICGHSEGALVGMLVCQNGGVTKYISIAGATKPAADILRAQLSAQPPVLEMSEPILAALEQGKTYENSPPMLNSLFRASVQPYLISWFKYDPAVELAKLKIPILLVQGTTDIQVKAEELHLLVEANPKCQQHIVEGMNHVLKEAPLDMAANVATYSQPELALHPELMAKLIAFVK